jgi:hypothetical protein
MAWGEMSRKRIKALGWLNWIQADRIVHHSSYIETCHPLKVGSNWTGMRDDKSEMIKGE